MPKNNLVRPLRENNNAAILDAIRNGASLDYRARVPSATKAGVEATLASLTGFRPLWNEFTDGLINRIGTHIVRNMSWSNSLGAFKKGFHTFGDTVMETNVGLLQAHTYDPTRDALERDIFATEVPDVQTNFHRLNRREFYKVSVNEVTLRNAFLEEGGLSNFVSALMEAPTTSDNWDEFLIMCSLFSTYESNGGFFHQRIPDVANMDSTESDAKQALRVLRSMADTLKFPSTLYNAARVPSHAQDDELVIMASPEFISGIDVNALAAAFNMEKMEQEGRFIPIPADQFQIDGAQAIMTTTDFFQVYDVVLENSSIYNPAALVNNYFLHHHQIISASRFVPAILYTTKNQTERINLNGDVTKVNTPRCFEWINTAQESGCCEMGWNEILPAGDADSLQLKRGHWYDVRALVETDPAEFPGKEVIWSVEGNTSAQTQITQNGTLMIGGNERGTALVIKATSGFRNPENLQAASLYATVTAGTTGPIVPEWPRGGEILSIEVMGRMVEGVSAALDWYEIDAPFSRQPLLSEIKVNTLNSPNVRIFDNTDYDDNPPSYQFGIHVTSADTGVTAEYFVDYNVAPLVPMPVTVENTPLSTTVDNSVGIDDSEGLAVRIVDPLSPSGRVSVENNE